MNWNKISSVLYKGARLSRDLNAISRGPAAMVKRVGRKAIGRVLARLLK